MFTKFDSVEQIIESISVRSFKIATDLVTINKRFNYGKTKRQNALKKRQKKENIK